tara:strand:+ start:206431 stop:207399 length:969 start_codon:yes stop_codon:yes gene_type:complete
MLQVKNISFSYHQDPVLQQINFTVEKGGTLAIVGESGSGKSTLLKLLYGEFDLNKGQIFWGEDEILGPKFNLITGPEYMKYVAQEFDLMPFTSVSQNIGEYLSNFYLKKKKERIEELIEVVELTPFAKTKVKYLSGGQKQRVALARALAKEPEILLLDEPFSHIDNLKRQSLRRNIFKHLKEQNITCIVATHDKDDIVSFADQMLVLNEGETLAYGTPKELYNKPKYSLVASFFDEFNEFKISEVSDINKFGIVMVYPHEIKLVNNSNLSGVVKKSYFRGNCYLVEVTFNERSVFFNHSSEIAIGKKIHFEIIESVLKTRMP